jgi:hypothetical protein
LNTLPTTRLGGFLASMETDNMQNQAISDNVSHLIQRTMRTPEKLNSKTVAVAQYQESIRAMDCLSQSGFERINAIAVDMQNCINAEAEQCGADYVAKD